MSVEGVSVAEAIEVLRGELEAALELGRGCRVQFAVPEVSVTLSVVASRAAEGEVKARWWVVDADARGKWSREQTQTLELTLRPVEVGADGSVSDLRVAADDIEVDADGDAGFGG
jgi:Trypsin-co-occurring domain 2